MIETGKFYFATNNGGSDLKIAVGKKTNDDSPTFMFVTCQDDPWPRYGLAAHLEPDEIVGLRDWLTERIQELTP